MICGFFHVHNWVPMLVGRRSMKKRYFFLIPVIYSHGPIFTFTQITRYSLSVISFTVLIAPAIKISGNVTAETNDIVSG
jgi:hypothetical protein